MAFFTPLRSSAQLLSAAVDSGPVPDEIRRSLQLVRACHQDLQRLINLRNQHLDLLQTEPRELEQVNHVICEAKDGLAEASRIVEKCRPEAHSGRKTPLRKRLAWVFSDSPRFQSQQPVVRRHHETVLAELNFLRQLALRAAQGKEASPDNGAAPHGNNLSLPRDGTGDGWSISGKASMSTLRPSSDMTRVSSTKSPTDRAESPRRLV